MSELEPNGTNHVLKGWGFVAIQGVLLFALIFWNPAPVWSVPDWFVLVANLVGLVGLVWLLVGALNLGTSLTATPVPRDVATLKTGGLYRLSRHPIYTGVIALALSAAMKSGHWAPYVLAAALYTLFEFKARFEEGLLSARYPEYAAYAARVPRFVPIGRRLG